MGRILAIDFGTKRIGLAVTDPLKIIASSLATVTAHEAIVWLKNYCSKEEVEAFVVGKPLQMDGTDSESAPATEKFISLLAKSFPKTHQPGRNARYNRVRGTSPAGLSALRGQGVWRGSGRDRVGQQMVQLRRAEIARLAGTSD
jgi:putative Holliday junction resolvase